MKIRFSRQSVQHLTFKVEPTMEPKLYLKTLGIIFLAIT